MLIEKDNWAANGCITCWSLAKMQNGGSQVKPVAGAKMTEERLRVGFGFAQVSNNAAHWSKSAQQCRTQFLTKSPETRPCPLPTYVFLASFGSAPSILVFTSVWGSL